MESGLLRLSLEQEQRARDLGYTAQACPSCDGRGEVPNLEANPPEGESLRRCFVCGGIGRMWATKAGWKNYGRGLADQLKIDRELAEILKRTEQ